MKLICVLENQFVFLETVLCFGKLICVLGNGYVFWEINLCLSLLGHRKIAHGQCKIWIQVRKLKK